MCRRVASCCSGRLSLTDACKRIAIALAVFSILGLVTNLTTLDKKLQEFHINWSLYNVPMSLLVSQLSSIDCHANWSPHKLSASVNWPPDNSLLCQLVAVASMSPFDSPQSALFNVNLCACLYFGAKKQKVALLRAWLIITGILLLIPIPVMVFMMIFYSDIVNEKSMIFTFALVILIELIYACFWTVAYSCYKEIKEQYNPSQEPETGSQQPGTKN